MDESLLAFVDGVGLYSAVGFLVGLNVYSIFRLYYWRRARLHYAVSTIVSVVYLVGLTFFDERWTSSLMFLAVMFSVFYAWRRIRVIQAFETRTGMRVRQQKYSVRELEKDDSLEQPHADKLTGG